MNPVVLHVVRPYASESELLAAEAWTVEARSMVLLGEEALEPDTVVIFDVALESGERLVRAEGRVGGYVAPTADHPGGPRVRFKRYGSQTKAFVERAVAYREAELVAASAAPVAAPAMEAAPAPAATPVEALSGTETTTAVAALTPAPSPETNSIESAGALAPADDPSHDLSSGIHRRPLPGFETPANRDELLARLRSRLAKTRLAEPESPASNRTG